MSYPIDIDAEAVLFEDNWYTREDLARRIKAMIDSGDYQVAKPSTALELLTGTLAGVRTLAFRCTPELADMLSQVGTQTNRTVGQVIRDSLEHVLSSGAAMQEGQAPVKEATQPGNPAQSDLDLSRGSAGEGAAKAAGPVTAGPGALRNAGLDESQPVELTKAKKKEDESAEGRWFKA